MEGKAVRNQPAQQELAQLSPPPHALRLISNLSSSRVAE